MDHLSIFVTDALRAAKFYTALLLPLGWKMSGFREGVYVGFKKPNQPALYLTQTSHRPSCVHLAFSAMDQGQVQNFHATGVAAGGVDNGAPGPRPEYGTGYYAAFVRDPDGHNLEAVLGGVG